MWPVHDCTAVLQSTDCAVRVWSIASCEQISAVTLAKRFAKAQRSVVFHFQGLVLVWPWSLLIRKAVTIPPEPDLINSATSNWDPSQATARVTVPLGYRLRATLGEG